MKIMEKFMVGLGLVGALSGVGQAMWNGQGNQGFQQYPGYTQPVYVQQVTGYHPAEVWLTVAFSGQKYSSSITDIDQNWTKEALHSHLFDVIRSVCNSANVPFDNILENAFNPYIWHFSEFLHLPPQQRNSHDVDGIRYVYNDRVSFFDTATQDTVQKGLFSLAITAEDRY